MNPSRIFILRPVATTLLMVAILIVGAIAYLQLPLSALPEVAYPTIQVQTFYPGASPEVITSAITAPLEKQFGQMPGLSQMSSTSSAGASVITLQFSLSLAIDVAEQQVQASISGAHAFEVFTSGLTRWWPHNYGVGKKPIQKVLMEPRLGGRWLEISEDGTETSVATITVWEPPHRLVMI